MPLGTEVNLGPGDVVLDGVAGSQLPLKRGTAPSFQFMSAVAKWWMDEDAAWYGSRPLPRPHCTRRAPSSYERGTAAPLFSAHVYCGHCRPPQLLLSSSWKR